MTTAYLDEYDDIVNPGRPNNLNIFFIILILFGVFLIYFLNISFKPNSVSEKYIVQSYETLTVEQIRVIEVLSGHAYLEHGSEVNAAFDCLGKNGSTKSFKTSGFIDKAGKNIPTSLWLCLDVDGSWYAVVTTIFEKIENNKVARLVTAYKVSTDLFPTIDDYISYIAVKWSATIISYSISAGEIFLQPK